MQGAIGMQFYFIVAPETVVAEDLADAIRAFDPEATVKTFRAENDALAGLEVMRPRLLILSREPDGFPATPLGRAVVATGVPIAFLGTFAGGRQDETVVLSSPFSDETVAALLRGLNA